MNGPKKKMLSLAKINNYWQNGKDRRLSTQEKNTSNGNTNESDINLINL